MVRRVCAFLSIVTMILAAGITPYAQIDVTGAWTLTINGPQGAVDTDATLTQKGDKVTGTFTSPMGETNVEGTISGSTLTMAFNVVTPNGPIDIKLVAEVAGSEMKGTVDFSMGTADFTGKKK